MYSHLKHDESATNRLLICFIMNPIELNSEREFGTELNQQGKQKAKLSIDQALTKCDTFRNAN